MDRRRRCCPPPSRRSTQLALLAALVLAPSARAGVPESAYRDLHWRLLGPFRGGWATAVAGVPGEAGVFYFGAADGGVWKTTDAGVTWRPLFDRETSASIGALAVAPSDPRVVWVGTGQIHQRWDIAAGDGVYRSADGGATWQHVGLEATRHIGALWVDPRDAGVAVVAALGRVFGPNPERGLYRTADGGRTWSHVLERGQDVGAADLAGDPALPDVLYASLWQVRRYPWLDYFQPPVGAGSGVWRSEDAGRTWRECGRAGLPTGALGRIELAVAPGRRAQRVWAAVDAPQLGGIYRSDDGCATWSALALGRGLASSYTSGVIADPADAEIVWAMGRSISRSTDGGKTFEIVKGAPGGDDYHTLWIDPADPRRMITGSDQGAVVTLNGGETWSSWYNQPTGQFYRLAADHRFPYRVYSGQQDSGTVGIATRSDYGQLTFRDWAPVGGDERDGDVPDPRDPDIVYGAGLGGRLSRFDATTGQVQNVAPWPVGSYSARPGSTRYRYDWITPLAISPRPPHALYLGAQVLFRSTNGGASWQTVSPDLTGAVPGAAGCAGDVPIARASACGFGAIFAIAPSAAADGLVWVGTTNGRIQLTRDDGATWRDVTPADLGDWTKINTIDPSPGDPLTAYVAADRHRAGDVRPLVWRTHDGGATWTAIGHGLPADEWVGVVRQDPARPGLLYAGTQRGVHVSFDDGDSWQSLQLDLPTTGINDLLVHDGDLVAATEGRALWALDAIEPLRHLSETALADGVFLSPPPRAVRVRASANRDTPLPPEEPRAANPPAGAVLDYVLGAEVGGPVVLEIRDGAGRLVRRFASDEPPATRPGTVYFAPLWRGAPPPPGAGPGHHRFVWDLRREPPPVLEADYSIAALPGEPTPQLPQGMLVAPGRYAVRLSAGGRSVEQPLEVTADPRRPLATADLDALDAFADEVGAALARAVPLARRSATIETRLAELVAEPRATRSRRALERAQRELPDAQGARAERAAAVAGELADLAADLEGADALPTAPQREVLADALARLGRAEQRWRRFEASTLAPLARHLAAAGLELEPRAAGGD
jgi:photosystem II stability/assembly factor-like uncharacterized protein